MTREKLTAGAKSLLSLERVGSRNGGLRHLILASCAACLLVVAPVALMDTAHAAGLFDAISVLFGGHPEPPRFQYRSPTQDFEPIRSGVRRRASPKPVKRMVRDLAPKGMTAINPAGALNPAFISPATLDPATNPTWYLQDPTLRLGDIVVLNGEVLVFEGGRVPYTRADFLSLSESRLSKSEREKLSAMTRLPQEARPQDVASATKQ